MKLFRIGVVAVVLFSAWPVLAQEVSADTMQALKEKLKADKKLIVSANLNLTDAEAKGFWPVYEGYQKELGAINQRMAAVIKSYADAYNADKIDDATAKKLLHEAVAIDTAESALRKAYLPKFEKVLPMKKVAIYYQIENKIRAVIKYELASEIPLAK
ncbi:MAG TPA: hypothetical protein VEI24_01825 [Nitrospiria bacterium]|nr:hypothetical protein [Nitrospiria bacterium]